MENETSGFDISTAGVYSTKVSCNVFYEVLPRIDTKDFSLGGLQFKLCGEQVNGGDGQSAWHAEYGLVVRMTEASRSVLAAGWRITMTARCSSETHFYPYDQKRTEFEIAENGTATQYAFVFPSNRRIQLGESIEVVISAKFEDVFPHRLRFVNRNVATFKYRTNCWIQLQENEEAPSALVYAHKLLLSTNSPFFHTLFFGDFKEKNQFIVPLTGVNQTDFLEYLYCVYAPSRPLAYKRLDTLLRLANRFLNDDLMMAIQKFLLEMPTKTAEQKRECLIWANQYALPTLFKRTLDIMKAEELKGTNYDLLSAENLRLIFKKFH